MLKLATILTILATPALSSQCGPREQVIHGLENTYGETRVSGGLAQGGYIEIFTNEDTQTFTITVTLPNCQTCLVASGENYNHNKPMPNV